MVHELAPGAALPGQPTSNLPQPQLLAQTDVPDASAGVRGMAWLGSQLAVCAGLRYLLVSPFGPRAGSSGAAASWQELLAVPEELAYSPAMLAAVQELSRAVLVVVRRLACCKSCGLC
jgi:hypothetical protein